MKLTKKQKIYAVLCGLAAGALLLDRMFPAPVEAPAAEAVAVVSQPASAATPDKPVARTMPTALVIPAGPSLASRIDEAAEANAYPGKPGRDAFRVADTWRPAAAAAQAPAPRADTDKFVRDHKLTAVMTAGDRGVALVDGTPVQIGQTLDGFRLVSVETSRALWECDGVRATLELTNAGDAGAKPASTNSR
jgi:hypothetical protein